MPDIYDTLAAQQPDAAGDVAASETGTVVAPEDQAAASQPVADEAPTDAATDVAVPSLPLPEGVVVR